MLFSLFLIWNILGTLVLRRMEFFNPKLDNLCSKTTGQPKNNFFHRLYVALVGISLIGLLVTYYYTRELYHYFARNITRSGLSDISTASHASQVVRYTAKLDRVQFTLV